MRVRLLDPQRDADTGAIAPDGSEDLWRDLDVGTLVDHMAAGDSVLQRVCVATLLSPTPDIDTIRWRQDVLDDCRAHPAEARQLYRIATAALLARRQVPGWLLGDHPSAVLRRSVTVLKVLLDPLRQVRDVADRLLPATRSEGMRAMLSVAREDLAEDYLADVADHLDRLAFRGGVVATARVGREGASADLTLRLTAARRRSLLDLVHIPHSGELTYVLPARDEAGGRILANLRDRALPQVADALSRSREHVMAFFTQLQWEMGFYVACLNLAEALEGAGLDVCRGEPLLAREATMEVDGLYDVSLALRRPSGVVGSDTSCSGTPVVVVTGANQGGKSTYLRGVGLAQLLLHAGGPVPARAFRASVATSVHTHFRREEDAGMQHGKLDEELGRMRDVVDRLRPGSLVLFNESFSSTNEREGSDIARTVVDGLVRGGVRVVIVTHLYDLAHGLQVEPIAPTSFLRAERLADGRRTFRIIPGDPQATSYGRDIYERVFG